MALVCRAPSDAAGCYSTFFSVNGISYWSIHGLVRGCQKTSTDSFDSRQGIRSIDNTYVDECQSPWGIPVNMCGPMLQAIVTMAMSHHQIVLALFTLDQRLPPLLGNIIFTVRVETIAEEEKVVSSPVTPCGMELAVLNW